MNKCVKCNRRPKANDMKYCRLCYKDVMKEMRDSGYLTDVTGGGRYVNHSDGNSRVHISTQAIAGQCELRSDEDE